MYRTKKDIDRHVADIFSRMHNENEKNLRGYNFARLYYQVRDYEDAKKHLTAYLSVREHHAPSHKLMAQIYEAEHDSENALRCYKRSLEIDQRQKDIILKICELYSNLHVDRETAEYWADRAEQIFPHNDIVFRLRESLVSREGNSNWEELEKLITTELVSRPNDLNMRLKMLKLYLDTERVKEAYREAVQLEKKKLFRVSLDWYYMLVRVFETYQDEFGQELDFNFYVLFLTALDHLVYLTLAEPHVLPPSEDKDDTKTTPTVNDAAAALQKFDCHLKKASEKDMQQGAWLYFLVHMKGQLYMHLGCLVTKIAKKEQGKWKEANRIAAALFLVGYTFKPKNVLHEVWFLQMDEQQKLFTSFYHEGSLRTSFIGHSIISMCKEDKSQWLQKIKQDVCLRQVRERTYNRLFSGVNCKVNPSESYFQTDSSFTDSSLEFPGATSLLEYDKSLYKTCPDSLHQLVWLHLHQKDFVVECFQNSLYEAFKGSPLKNNNLSKGSPESLCLLDIESYLIAVIYTTNLLLEQKTALYSHSIDNSLSVPPFIASQLCTAEQSAWWRSAYCLVNRSVKERFSDHRRILQHGLEVIRAVHNHGLEIQLVVHLARTFADKAAALNQDSEQESPVDNENAKSSLDKVAGLEHRAVHYWNVAISMLDVLSSNLTLRVPQARMFHGYSEKLSLEEIVALKEEGQLYLACRLMNTGSLEDAVKTLEKLTTPHASYYLALCYKKLALQEEPMSNTRTALLHKAKDALYLTMDRIKGDTVHVLNEDLYIEIEDVEQEIDKQLNFANANTSQDSLGNECDVANFSFKNISRNTTPLTASHLHSTPRLSATFMTARSKLEHRTHLEPSPERLDAQIRALASSQSTLIKTLVEQQRSLLETNKAIIDSLKQNTDVVVELKKKMDELQISNKKSSHKASRKKAQETKPPATTTATSANNDNEDGDDDEVEENSDSYEANGVTESYVSDALDSYQNSYNYNHTRMINSNVGAAAAMTYVPPAGLAAAHPPAMPHYGYQYPHMAHHGIAQPPPHGAIPNGSQYYPSAINHGLPFTEGQPLPQFRFHVGSSMMKPPMFNNMPHGMPSQAHPSSSWVRQGAVPHAFQIPMPSANIPTSLSHPPVLSSSQYIPSAPGSHVSPFMTSAAVVHPAQKQSPPFNMRALLSNPPPGYRPDVPLTHSSLHFSAVNQPVHSTPPEASLAMFSAASKGSNKSNAQTPDGPSFNRSRQDSDVYSDADIEPEVMGDFTPLIPLPAEVKVQTGEEDESVLFESRAKLFRFIEGEWKERGIGTVKLLKHKLTGHIRLLMRRDQVHKVCANHRLLPSMKILPLKGSDKALTWAAQDFADETVKLEQFCIRFKTGDIAADFKAAFDNAVKQAEANENRRNSFDAKVIAPPVTSPGFASKGLPRTGSWTCPTCLVSNVGTRMSCIACDTNRPGSATKTTEHSTNPSKSPFTMSSSQSVAATSTAMPLCNFSSKPFLYQAPVISMNETGLQKDAFGLTNKQPVSDTTGMGKTTQSSVFGKFSFPSSIVSEPAIPCGVPQNRVSVQASAPEQPPAQAGIFGSYSFAAPDVVSEPSLSIPSETSVTLVSKSNISGPIAPPQSLAKAKDEKSTMPFLMPVEKPQATEDTKSVSMFGGFTFTSAPIVADKKEDMKEREILVVSTKSKDGPQVTKVEPGKSPFSGFKFKPETDKLTTKMLPNTTEENHAGENNFVFGCSNKLSNANFLVDSNKGGGNGQSPGSLFVTVGKDGRRVSTDGAGDTPEEFVPTAEFEPAIPMPALVNVKTGEEDEEKLFGERVRLYRYDPDSKEWKERGVGELKVLAQSSMNKYRILMRREQVLKICANHYIYSAMKLSPLSSSDKAWVWVAQDYSDGDLKQERFAARFKSPAIAQEFYNVIEKCRSQLEQQKQESVVQNDSKPEAASNSSVQSMKDGNRCAGNKMMFSDLFKPAPESWECPSCYVRNEKNLIRCQACETLKPLGTEERNASASWTCGFCHLQNSKGSSCVKCGILRQAGDSTMMQVSNAETTSAPLSHIFKPDPSSWECKSCYVRNDKSQVVCMACETPKPGTTATAPSAVFGQLETKSTKPFSAGFVFGATDSQMKPFTFGTFPNASNSASGLSSTAANNTASFGGISIPATSTSSAPSSVLPTSGFVFGKPSIVPASDPNKPQPVSIFGQSPKLESEHTNSVGFKFGSPQKYEFNFSGVRPRSPSKCPKSPKSPGTPADVEEEEEEVEQSDVDNIYFQPVIPLPPKVDVKTGEEDEEVLFVKRAKLFRFVDGEWKERGIGDVKILFNSAQNTARLLMRREQVLKVCLNHYLTKDIAFTWKSKNSLSWATADFSENEPSPEQFAIRFKTAEFAQQFKEALDLALHRMDPSHDPQLSPISSEGPEPSSIRDSVRKQLDFSEVVETVEEVSRQVENSYDKTLSSFSFTVNKVDSSSPFSLASRFGASQSVDKSSPKSSFFATSSLNSSSQPKPIAVDSSSVDPDIEIIYEALPTPEQVKAAEKLMLPKTFFLYQNKAPCPGCQGCEEHENSPQKAEVTKIASDKPTALSEEPTLEGVSEEAPNLFSNTTLSVFSFADLASKNSSSGFAGLVSDTSKVSFPGAGAPVFGGNVGMNQSTEEEEGDVVQSPDVHFEPVIPLPSLVEVKTGEEDELVVFCQRAKLYRYDGDTRQWKERGVGELKILQHKETGRYRLLLRRDQVHKVACNHALTSAMELKPMNTSENSVCWSAIDYSEGRPENSQFAVRFKNKEILLEFKSKFEECKNALSKSSSPTLTRVTPEVATIEAPTSKDLMPNASETINSAQPQLHTCSEDEDDDDGDDELYFEETVQFAVFDEATSQFRSMGNGHLQVLYDDNVYGYRILVTNDSADVICDHIIAVQTCLRVEQMNATWTAIDISIEPAKRRQFRATFSSADSLEIFKSVFEDGKQMAIESEIVEKTNNVTNEFSPINH